MHSIAKPFLIIAGIIFALCAAGVLCLNIYLQSAGVQLKLRQAVAQATGFEPAISKTYYTPWSGLTVSGIKVTQPDKSKKPMLSVRSMKCRLRFSSLLKGSLVIKDITFEEPSLILMQGVSGMWPRESALPFQNLKLKAPSAGQTTPVSEGSNEAPTHAPTPSLQIAETTDSISETVEPRKLSQNSPVVVEKISIHQGSAAFYPAEGGSPIRLDGCAVEGSLLQNNSATGSFRIKNATFSELARCTEITGDFEYHEGYFKITNLQAAWAQGTLKGSMELSDGPGSFFVGSLEAEKVSLQKLAEEAGFSAEGTKGELFAKTHLQGVPGKPESFTGTATASLAEARMQPIEPLRQLGELLRINELRVLELRTAETALMVRDGKIFVDRLELESSNLLMDAIGEAQFNGALDLDARFHVGNKMLKESLGFMGSKFKPSDREGYSHMPFSITGTLARPKSDLLDKLVGIRLGDDVGGLLKNLLRMPKKEKKKNKPDSQPDPTN